MFQFDCNLRSWAQVSALTAALVIAALPALATDGHFMHGVGPVNQAMGGAGTGACLDVLGSIAWNPSCTTSFQGWNLDLGAELFIPFRMISSSVAPNAFGPGLPAVPLSGSTESATNSALLPSFGLIRHASDSPTAYHFAVIGVAGFGVDYPQDLTFTNPILTPQPPTGMGFGQIKSNYSLMKMPAGIARQLTDRLSIGFSIVPAFGMLTVSPAPFAPPVVSAGSPYPNYLNAAKTAKAFGIGASAGLHYQVRHNLSLGFDYQSPVRFRKFSWNSLDSQGVVHNLSLHLDVPSAISGGVGYMPASGTLLAADVRWIDYKDTRGFKNCEFGPDGAVTGFGWKNIWTAGGGVQQDVWKRFKIRLGYNYSQDPIPSSLSFFNVPAPAIVQHHITAGLSHQINKTTVMNIAYYHVFLNKEHGPFVGAAGPVPGTSVTSQLAEDSVSIGFSRHF